LESASAIVGSDGHGSAPPVIDVVQWLVDKSFVRQLTDQRFDLLESVREYAAQHLRTEGRFAQSGPGCGMETLARHWRYFAGLDARAEVDNSFCERRDQ